MFFYEIVYTNQPTVICTTHVGSMLIQGVLTPPPPPRKITKLLGFFAILVRIPLKITKLPSQHSISGRWWPVLVVFLSTLPSSTKKKVGPPLTKPSGSAHGDHVLCRLTISRLNWRYWIWLCINYWNDPSMVQSSDLSLTHSFRRGSISFCQRGSNFDSIFLIDEGQ